MLLKSCPRCETGDLALDSDPYGGYIKCAQCGYVRDLDHHAFEVFKREAIITRPAHILSSRQHQLPVLTA